VRVADNVEAAVWANDAILSLESCVLIDTHPTPEGRYGRGLEVAGPGAHAVVSLTRIARNHNVGAAVGLGGMLQLRDSVVEDVTRDHVDPVGRGVQARSFGRLILTRSAVRRVAGVGIVLVETGTSGDFDRVSIGPIEPVEHPEQGLIFGHGMEIGDGATLRASATVIHDTTEGAVHVYLDVPDAPTAVSLQDVIVKGVGRTDRGFGLGLQASGGVQVHLSRVAIAGTRGTAISATAPPEGEPRFGVPSIDGRDVFVVDVTSSTVGFADGAPAGRTVAYGIHVGGGAVHDFERLALIRGGFGLAGFEGELAVRTGVIAGQADAAGVRVPGVTIELTDVVALSNADDDVVERSGLPEGAALPAPTPVCLVETECP
jgi:hypothetical protein